MVFAVSATVAAGVLIGAGLVAMAPPPLAAAVDTSVEAAASSSVDSSIVKAADLSQFKPGNIISDAVFFNSATMTEAQIQSFLESKVTSCRSGYTCLKDYYVQTRSIAADAMCGAYSGGGSERASRVIFKVAQACGINPQVILVMLQKEQGLITSTAPSAWAYQAAMGQGCPDTAACDTAYYGLFNQVYGGARQMKRYANPPGTSNYFTWYAPGKTWNVQYHPNTSCGRGAVYIENQATANLYYYTPYQPNAAALSAGYGLGDGCSSYGNRNFFNYFTDWFGSTQGAANNPFGNVELVQTNFGSFRVAGWAIDPNTKDPIDVHVYVNGVGYAVKSDQSRADVGSAFPSFGSNHGFDAEVPASSLGNVTICLYAINVGAGVNTKLACTVRESRGGSPVGALDTVTGGDSSVQVSGWALDPDTPDPIDVHVYVDSVGTAVRADNTYADVGAEYPAYGSEHGFSGSVKAAPGLRQVCVYAINQGSGVNSLLGCKTVTVTGEPDLGRNPIGGFEAVTVSGSNGTVAGWALDPDTVKPITVHIYVNGVGKAYTADKARSDIAAVYPSYGASHGFSEQVALSPGSNEVCVFAINSGTGANTPLGCKTVTVTVAEPDLGRNPIGGFEAVTVSGSNGTVAGWALDPDTVKPITVHIYVNGVGKAYTADKARSDIAAVYPSYGASHGFSEQVALSPGSNEVCVFAINSGTGANTPLGCKTVTVTVANAQSRPPFGNVELVASVAGGVRVAGWALDPDTTASIQVHIYVGATGTAILASSPRADVGVAYKLGDAHGFDTVVPASSGTYNVCLYAIDSAGGSNTGMGCRPVTVP